MARGSLALSSAAMRVVESLEGRLMLHAGDLEATALAPYNGQQKVATTVNITAKFATALDPTTVNVSTVELRDANNNVVPSTVSYNATTKTITLDPTPTLATTNGYYTAKLKGGVGGVEDTTGMGFDEDLTWSFTTGTPTFSSTPVFTGLTRPTNIQFSPDGRVFVAEKSGIIKVYSSLTATTPTIFADLRTEVHDFWDRGLLGLALDPQFTTGRPYVYVLYSYDGDIGGPSPKFGAPGTDIDPGPDATGSGAKISGRLSRLTASGNTMVAGSEKVLIGDWAQQFPSHSVGTIAFGPDGKLYASAGEGANFSVADYGQLGNPFGDPAKEGGALRAQDLQTPNDPTSLDGSIIRIDPDTGLGVSDNPLYATGNDANAKRIIAEGLRNPFRFTFRPGTSEIWLGDVGSNYYEEINRLVPSTTAVTNFGWPAYEGNSRQPGFDALDLPLIENLYAKGANAVTFPFFTYAHAEQVIKYSAESDGGSSTTGVAFYTGNQYPSAYQNAFFFADYSRKSIYVMYQGPSGDPDPSTRQLFQLGDGATMLTMGPDGKLYYVDANDGRINRFDFFTGNRPPTARITQDQTSGAAPLTVAFSAASSSDPDTGDALSYSWDLNGDGVYGDSTAVSFSKTYTAGTYTVGLKVTDSKGAFNVTSVVISAGNTPPVATITAPLTTLKWKVGDTINFAGKGVDTQDGTLAGSSLHWVLLIRHENLTDPTNFHYHQIQEFDGTSGSFTAPDHEYPSKLELRLIATDSGGLQSTTAVLLLQPQTTTLTLKANLAGIKLGLNEDSFTSPTTQTVIVGSANTLSAPTPITINGVLYQFNGWSDGGSAVHDVTAGATAVTYTANYAAAAALPAPWTSADIGTVGVAGNSTYDATGKKFTINGAGADIWGTSDSFRYVYQTLTGDGSIVARVVSFQQTYDNAKAGVQFRQSLSTNAANVEMDLEGALDWGEFHARAVAGAETTTQNVVDVNPPYWVKLVRAGDLFSGYVSADGVSWRLVSSATVVMTAQIYVGLIVCSHNTEQLNTAVFDNVTVAATPVVTGDVTAGLTHRYKLDENTGTTAIDAVGGKTGLLTSGATWTAGKSGSGVNLNGSTGVVDVNTDLSADLGGTASLTAWIKTNQVGTADFWLAPGIAGSEQNGGGNDVFWGILNNTGKISVKAGDGALATSTSTVNDGQWHFVAFTRNASTGQLQVFVDGALQATVTGETGAKTTPFQAFGRIEHDVTDDVYYQGALDEMRTYNRVLTAAEVAAIKAATSTTTTTTGAPTVATAARVSPSAPFVGVAANLSVLGADDGGEAKLTYTWSVVTSPTGAVAPTFGVNGTNAAKNTTVTFATAGVYSLRVTISDGTQSVVSSISMSVGTFGAAKINFQPSAATTVSGYSVDSGNLFGVWGTSLAYGWNTSHTTAVFDRGANSNQLLDTVLLLKAGAKWEIAVPSGTYSVKVSVGDASSAATNTINIEGKSLFAATNTAANVFSNKTISVSVTDGKLTLDNGSAALNLTRLNYIEITKTA